MKIIFSKSFVKQFKKVPVKIQDQFKKRLKDLNSQQNVSSLKIHALKGEYKGYKSMNVSGDWRALFYQKDNDIFIFELMGTHSQLYK